MSWHTSVIYIAQREPSDFAALFSELGFPGGTPTDRVDFEAATSSMATGKSIAHVDGWTVICDPMFFISPDLLADKMCVGIATLFGVEFQVFEFDGVTF